MLKAILFDLDGTLLPMDQDEFVKRYFHSLISALARQGYEPEGLSRAMWVSIGAMISNNGAATNEEIFWQAFSREYGKDMTADIPLFEKFYNEEFDKVSSVARPDERVPELISTLKGMGIRLILATNPVFPSIATRKRALWAGVDVDDFELFTAYENSSYCKPNLDYYRAILDKLSLKGEECLMVGNDVGEDMIAEELGMRVFLIDKYMINKQEKDISLYPHGDFSDLYNYILEQTYE